VAHFLLRCLNEQPITIYGDGLQVRDILFVDDLIEALLLAHSNMAQLSGQASNIGGGPSQAISLLELLDLLTNVHAERPFVQAADWRPGDQHYYVSDTRKFHAATGWTPRIGVREGIRRLYQWLVKYRELSAPRSAVSQVAS
jgi:CDP-paratose 2-epimerase